MTSSTTTSALKPTTIDRERKHDAPPTGRRIHVADCNGAPTLHVDGKPLFLQAPYLAKAPYATFEKSKFEILMVYDGPFPVASNGQVDLTEIRRQIRSALSHDPRALIVIRFFPPAPSWWLDAHPDDVMRFDVDVTKYPGFDASYRDVSWGSDAWKRAATKWVGDWCGQIWREFPDNVICFQFGMGLYGENNALGSPNMEGRWFCSDFSPAMHRHFREWLRAKYQTGDALRAAWNDTSVTLDSARVPDRIERLRTDWFTFRDPHRAQVADYYQAIAERMEDLVLVFCREIKRVTLGHCLTGSHLGALMDNGLHGYIYSQAGINMFRRALDDPAIDLFTSPASYINRQPGGESTSMMPTGSIALHGKIVYQDQDSRTCALSAEQRSAWIISDLPNDHAETTGQLKRDFGAMLIRGYGHWWHPLVRGMYDDPAIGDCIAKVTDIGRKSLRHPRGVPSDVAFIVDEESVFHQECANRLIYPMLYHQRQHEWGRAGVAWDVFLHNDLSHPRMPRHKLYCFLNTFYLTDEEMREIQQHLRGSGATVIWTYAPGIQSPAGFSLDRVRELTGFRVKAASIQALPRVTFTKLDHPYVRYQRPTEGDSYVHGNLPPGAFGTGPLGNDERERVIGPIIYVDDPSAEVLGELDCLQQPGFCVKRMDGWTSVFSAAPMLNRYLLRHIAEEAGAHVYSRGEDVVLVGRSFIMLHARSAGEKVIDLPNSTDVYECYDGRDVGRGVKQIRDRVEKHRTALYFLGSQEKYSA